MNKFTIISIFVLFIIYTIVEIFIEIPKVFNNVFYGIITIFAIYFSVFHLELGKGIKDRFTENKRKYSDKQEKN